MQRPPRVARLALVALVVAAASAAAAQSGRPLGPTEGLVGRYLNGDRTAVLAEIGAAADVTRLARDLRQHADDWADRDRRWGAKPRLAVATFLLEVAAVRLEHDWRRVRDLVELGCTLTRSVAPDDPALLTWHLAALALAEGAADTRLLLSDSQIQGIEEQFGHLAHSRHRFPWEARFRLAEVVVREMGISDTAPPRDQPWRTDEEWRSVRVGGAMELALRRERRQALERFEPLLTLAGVADEARLRTAHLLYQLHQDAAALEQLRLARANTSDPFVIYISHLLTSMIDARGAEPASSEASLRRALETVPRAQSATQLLAARLFLAGRADEAYTLGEQLAADRTPPPDPWRLFGYGDYRRFPDLIAQLRIAVRP